MDFSDGFKQVCRAHVRPRIVKCKDEKHCICIGVRRCVDESKDRPLIGDTDVLCNAVVKNGKFECPDINTCAKEPMKIERPLKKSNSGSVKGTSGKSTSK